MSDSVQPHRQQPTRLPCPWDSPGKNTGVGCHFLLQCMKVKSKSEVAQSCLTLSDPMDCSLPGSSVHGIFQARVLEWGAIAFSTRVFYSTTIHKHQFFGSQPCLWSNSQPGLVALCPGHPPPHPLRPVLSLFPNLKWGGSARLGAKSALLQVEG